MYRLLIVDDEPIITDGLYEVFQDLSNPELDVYKAYSGEEALEMLNRTRIDIVLTDIRMPGLNGLELLEHIRKRWPKCRVIFLTGYNEFDYIYTAVKYEGVNYILKTEGYGKVIGAIENAIKEMEKSFRQNALLEEAKKQLETAKELICDNFLSGIIKGRFIGKEINRKQFDKAGIALDPLESVILLVGRIDNFPPNLPYSEMNRRLCGIGIAAKQYFSYPVRHIYFTDDNNYLIWFIQPELSERNEESVWQQSITFIKGNVELVQTACMKSMNASISFALDDSPAHWTEIPDRFATLKMVLNYRFGQDPGMLLMDRSVMEEGLRHSQAKSTEKLSSNRLRFELLAETLEYGKKDDFLLLLDELTHELKQIKSMHNMVAVEQYSSIALILLSYINRWRIFEKVAFKIGIHKLMRPDEHESWIDAVSYLRELSIILFEIQKLEQEKRTQDVIGFIQKYINENIHIQDEITLIRLAELVHFNPSYLSRLFKQISGINLSDYISDIKIKKAKQLLENKDIKINEVAEYLGYGTAANFTRFFKKATNMTPQEYRELNP